MLKQWRREELTVEMAAGHLAQNRVHLQERLEQFKGSILKVRKDVDSLITHTNMPPSQLYNRSADVVVYAIVTKHMK